MVSQEHQGGKGDRTYEASVVAPVPSSRIQHVRGQNRADNSDDDVQIAAQHHSLDLQPPGRNLRDERVADGSYCQLVDQCPENHHGSCSETGGLTIRDETEEAHDEEHGAEAHQAVEVEGSTAYAESHQAPGTDDADHVDCVLAHCEGVRVVLGNAGGFEEVLGTIVSRFCSLADEVGDSLTVL